jgi:hypothetical protein
LLSLARSLLNAADALASSGPEDVSALVLEAKRILSLRPSLMIQWATSCDCPSLVVSKRWTSTSIC